MIILKRRFYALVVLTLATLVSISALPTGQSEAQVQTLAPTTAATQSYLPTLAPDEKVAISFYDYNLASAGQGADGTNQLIQEFMAANPNITVNGVGVPFAQLLPRIQADTAAGNPPDVAQLIFSDLNYVTTNYAPVPLEHIVSPAELQAQFAGMHPNTIGLGKLNGLTYALPYTLSTPIVYYNADLFKAAGLDPDNPPTTWDQVKDAALKISKLGKTGFHIAVLDSGYDWIFQALVLSNGGRVLSQDGTTLTFADPAAVGAVQMLRDLVQSGAHPNMTGQEAITAFKAGNLGMYLETSQIQASLVTAAKGKFDLRAMKLPAFAGKTPHPVNSGSALFIFAKDPVKQRAAWEFLKFITSARGYTIIASKIGYVPLRPAIVNDPQYLKAFADANPLIKPNLEQLDNLSPWVALPGPNYLQIVKTMLQAVQQAMYGSDDNVVQIMMTAQQQATALLH